MVNTAFQDTSLDLEQGPNLSPTPTKSTQQSTAAAPTVTSANKIISKIETAHNPIIDLMRVHFSKIIIGLLIIQGLWAMAGSINSIFIQIPQLEQQLAMHQITQEQVNHLANKAILMTASTILSLFFALRISIVRSTTTQRISVFLALIIVIGNTQISRLLNKLGSSQLITTLVVETFKSILVF